MSTSYYLTKKSNKKIMKEYDDFLEKNISNKLAKIQGELLSYLEQNGIDYEDEISDRFNDLKNNLKYILEIDDEKICVTRNGKVCFDYYYINLQELVTFFTKDENNNAYIIEDEYDREYTLKEFIDKIQEYYIRNNRI